MQALLNIYHVQTKWILNIFKIRQWWFSFHQGKKRTVQFLCCSRKMRAILQTSGLRMLWKARDALGKAASIEVYGIYLWHCRLGTTDLESFRKVFEKAMVVMHLNISAPTAHCGNSMGAKETSSSIKGHLVSYDGNHTVHADMVGAI